MRSFSPIRALLVLLSIAVCFCALLGRVAYLQTDGRKHTLAAAERQQHMTEQLVARRGTIFDRNGFVLACTTQQRTVFVDPKFMRQQILLEGKTTVDQAINDLAKALDQDPAALSKKINQNPDARFVRISDAIDETAEQAIRDLDIPGIGFQPINIRNYPMGSLAAHIIGDVGKGGDGLEGLEMKYDKVLSGHDGSMRTLKDAQRQGIAVLASDYHPPDHGHHLVLTIDSTIQSIVEQQLDDTCKKFNAQRAEGVVMDPRTGDVLALANWPTFNPQNVGDSTEAMRRDRAITDPYEPGSTIKPFIAGPAMAWNFTRPSEMFDTASPYITSYGRRVSDVHSYSRLAMWDVLVKSSNIGMSKLGERMGNSNLYRALTSFNFGKPTGIELPGEASGRVYPLDKWTKYSTESVSQGYEIMVTPLQLARAFCAYANGGKLVHPRIIQGILDDDGDVVSRNPQVPLDQCPEIIAPEARAEISRILCDVPIRGTAVGNRSLIWNIFGKTGTAHISNGKGGYDEEHYTSSFMAAAPYENPRLVVAIIVHDVKKDGKNYYGGHVSAPPALKIFERSLSYLDVPPSPDLQLPPPQIASELYNFNPKAYERTPTTTAQAE
ncbi:MAG TPA: penicillin-binding protein 2 [Tepidisphaeraceae bacterium]|jgi:cell division protein FtsI/penicillin-binding protein 2